MFTDDLQTARHRFIQETEEGVLDLCRQHGVVPPIWKPLPPKPKGSPRKPRRLGEQTILSNTLLVSLGVTFVALVVPAIMLIPAA